MRSWTSRRSAAASVAAAVRLAAAALGVAATALILAAAQPAAADWSPSPRLRISGGGESDLVIETDTTRTVVPGGSFLDLNPGVTFDGSLGARTRLRIGTEASLERFLGAGDRLLYAHSAWSDLSWRPSPSWGARFSLGASFFNDSARETARRLGGGAEAGVHFGRSRWTVEVAGGARGRRYPRLTTADDEGVPGTYTETGWGLDGTLSALAGGRTLLSARASRQENDARDPLYDARAWQLEAGARVALGPRWRLLASTLYQERDFTRRAEGGESDLFLEAGAALEFEPAPGLTLALREGSGRYTWPTGAVQRTNRLELALRRTWGAPEPPLPRGLRREPGESALLAADSSLRREGAVVFRLHARAASRVAVVGDFNGWDPERDPLAPAAAGWWEGVVLLAPGTYAYAYLVDGVALTPPEASATVDDGFGGRNGLLEVLSDEP